MCILELSKLLMYKFHYDYIKNTYDNRSRLLFLDTDSLMYEIKTEDIYEDFSSNKKPKGMNKSIAEKLTHNEYEDVLLNNE